MDQESDLRESLLSNEVSASGVAPDWGRAQPKTKSSLKATAKETKVQVEVPRVQGRTEVLEIYENCDGLGEALEAQQQEERDGVKRNDCSVQLRAQVDVEANAPKTIERAAIQAAAAFRALVEEYCKSAAAWEDANKDASEQQLQQEFHRNITQVLSSGLDKQDPLALIGDFSSAENLLGEGVDEYVKAINKLLSTGLDDRVTISFQNLNYIARTPSVTAVEGYNTVAKQLFNIAFGCCIFGARAIRNMIRGAPPVEFDETPILSNLTGQIKPGRLTLVLGPPGCGKTSFLRAIAGKTYGPLSTGTVTTGTLCYNERAVSSLKNLAAWVSYVGQSDEHQALLTVRETLGFAFKSRKITFYDDSDTVEKIRYTSGEAAVNRLKALKELEVDITLALLGLSGCADTVIGNENLKGVSGGERRRVTFGEMLVTGSQVLCCDEISTGLDSAATFDIVAYLRSAAHALQKSVVVALLQPPPEVIDLFDDVMVLAEGEIIYHGEREHMQSYFESLGFEMPIGKDLGDFVVELPTRNGPSYQMSRSTLEAKNLPPPPVTPAQFAARWSSSEQFQEVLASIEKEHTALRPKLFDYDTMPERGFWKGLWDTFVWAMTLRLRDRIQIFARIFANLIVGTFFGTLFWQLKLDDWWLKAMLFIMELIFLISTAFPTVQIMSQQRPIFYKHVEAKFYSPTQFTLAYLLVSIPFVAFDVFCFGTSMYWMCGLAPHLTSYLVFLGVSISFGICMNTVMSTFPFITPKEDTGIVVAALFLILSVVSSGALSTESMIPVLWRWMMWVNPLAWSYRALAINEYHTKEYDKFPCHFTMLDISLTLQENCNTYFLSVREIRGDDRYIPASVFVNILFTALWLFITIYALAYIRFPDTSTGATPTIPSESEYTTEQDKKVKREYLKDKYLDAVSPRSLSVLNTLSSTGVGYEPDRDMLASPAFNSKMVQTPLKTLIVRDLWYTIPINGDPVDFLKGVTFYAEPGRLCALMGSSGAGKTTLMDVISGRKTVGNARGEILINGEPKVQHEFVKYTGYVEQFGVHANCATIEESLRFSASLRLPPSTGDKAIGNYVAYILELLELDDIKDCIAGNLSMEQNKRLTLGVELVANPSIIFCDEPTSGLDARAAAIVMRVLLKVARSGRTVVCTIHQPSTVIFNFFDDLLLLKRGGEVVYFGELGEGSQHLVDYLEAVPMTKPCPKAFNPATWMLEVIGAGTGADSGAARSQIDYAKIYLHSDLKRKNDHLVENKLQELGRETNGSTFNGVRSAGIASPLASPYYHANADAMDSSNLRVNDGKLSDTGGRGQGIYVRSETAQIYLLLKRNLQTYWRSPEFSLNRLLVVMIFTGIFACFFFLSELHNVSDVIGRIVNIFFFSSLTCIYNLYTLVPFALSRRALYYRERAQNMYSVFAFNMAEGLVELPWIIVQVSTTVPLIYFLTNLNSDGMFPFLYFCLCIFLILLLMTNMGLFAASLFPDALAAQLAAVGALITLMVFCGIIVPKQNLPDVYVPMYYLSFFKYSSEGLLTTQFHGLPDIICLPNGVPLNPDSAVDKISHWMHKLVDKWPENVPLCTKDGNFDLSSIGAIQRSIKGVTGIQMGAEVFVLDKFAKDYDFDNRWLDLGVLLAWSIVLRVLTFVVMYFVNHQKR